MEAAQLARGSRGRAGGRLWLWGSLSTSPRPRPPPASSPGTCERHVGRRREKWICTLGIARSPEGAGAVQPCRRGPTHAAGAPTPPRGPAGCSPRAGSCIPPHTGPGAELRRCCRQNVSGQFSAPLHLEIPFCLRVGKRSAIPARSRCRPAGLGWEVQDVAPCGGSPGEHGVTGTAPCSQQCPCSARLMPLLNRIWKK